MAPPPLIGDPKLASRGLPDEAPPVLTPAVGAYLEADAAMFASYGLEPRARQLEFGPPAASVRVLEIGTGEPTLFLHGFGLCTAHWAPLLAKLPSPRAYALDLPGHGASDGVDYRGLNLRDWYRQLLTTCLARLGLESVHVVGHSQGAMIGMWLALDAPERVRSLVAIGTPGVAFGAKLDPFRMLARPGLGRLMLSMPKPAAVYRSILAGTMGRDAVAAFPELVRTTYLASRRSDHGRTVSSYLREMFAGLDGEPPRYLLSDAELSAIRQPVLIMWGERDNAYQPIAEAKSRAAHMPNARFELVPGGHEPWLDDATACADLLSAFWARQ